MKLRKNQKRKSDPAVLALRPVLLRRKKLIIITVILGLAVVTYVVAEFYKDYSVSRRDSAEELDLGDEDDDIQPDEFTVDDGGEFVEDGSEPDLEGFSVTVPDDPREEDIASPVFTGDER
jgi:hypothetical protein